MILQIKTFNKRKGSFGNYILEIKDRYVINCWYSPGYEKSKDCTKDIDFSITVDESNCNRILKENFLGGK